MLVGINEKYAKTLASNLEIWTIRGPELKLVSCVY